jgi:two-component system, NtrC family, response regulator HydG
MARILLVEDDLTFVQLLRDFLHRHSHTVDAAKDVASGMQQSAQHTYDLLLLDYRLPDGNGLDLLSRLKKQGTNIPAIMMTSFDDVRTAVRAMRCGVFDYITKPINPEELLMILDSALETPRNPVGGVLEEQPDFIKGKSSYADKLYEHIDLVAPTDMSVIIEGESGTGKEYAARCIHRQSRRADRPFMAIDCGALPKDIAGSELFGHIKGAFTGAIADKKGLFEAAKGGTVFLDEIGNLGYDTQVKLLRVLQEKNIQPLGSTRTIPVDIRLIAATNEELLASVQKGDFRLDLYHRLNEFKIQVPPLRERRQDLDLFIRHFIDLSNRQLARDVQGISEETRRILHAYEWPGNLRELKNVIKRMVLLTKSKLAEPESLPDEMTLTLMDTVPSSDTDLKAINESTERLLIEKTLQKVRFNKSKAAKLLNIDRKTLYYKMGRYGMH